MKRHLFPLLLTPDPAEGEALDEPTPPPAAPPPPRPPAASIVNDGKKVEIDVAWEVDNKKLQTRIAELEDENRSLKTVLAPPPPPPPKGKKSWLEGGSLFED